MNYSFIPTGRVWVDPGGAFGLVPRSLWSRYQRPNQNHMIPMDLNSLLIIDDGKTILVDNGLGDKLDDRAVKIWGLEYPEGTLVENLAKHDLTQADINIVINTHLHSDHCGGNTIFSDGKLEPAFPNAVYCVQQLEWHDATHPNVRTRGTYFPENFVPVQEAGQYQFLDGDTQITKNVRTVVTRGHTPGHQSVILENGSEPVMFLADFSSYAIHFAKTAWVTAYDVEPLKTIASKENWQPWAYDTGALLIFQHDITIRAGKLVKDEKGRYQIETVEKGSITIPDTYQETQ
jgi:glyoxylase-like metal-dependent hydrolase (beta-lactamase superfamily II)